MLPQHPNKIKIINTKMSSNEELIITRSEATNLVQEYMKCQPSCDQGTHITRFRDMTSSDNISRVLVGKVPSHKDTETIDMFFNTIKELVDSLGKEKVYKTQERIISTTMREYCALYCGPENHCQYIRCPAELAVWYLSHAINNYFQQTHEHIKEENGDFALEYNTCSVCDWIGNDYFYYTTKYGLNMPVCIKCVKKKEKEEKQQEEEQLDEYAEHVFIYQEYEIEPRTCSVCNYFGCGSYYYSSDKMNEPVCESCEMNYRNTNDCEKRIYHD